MKHKFFFLTFIFNLAILQFLPFRQAGFNQLILAQNMKKAFINGKIYTVNEKQPYAEMVMTEGNKITYAGKTNLNIIDAQTSVYDLEGKLMLPGFNDSHLHFTSGGQYLLGINLRPALSKEDFVFILKNYVKGKEDRWITVGRWDHELWLDKTLPTKELIDSVTPNTPVLLSRIDGHVGIANSLALRLAGITKDTPSPDGGLIEKDPSTGEPTGILKDNAMDLVFKIIPPPSIEENIEAALRSLEEAKKFGITSVQDMTQSGELEAYNKILEDGKLTCRIYSIWPIDRYEDLVFSGVIAG